MKPDARASNQNVGSVFTRPSSEHRPAVSSRAPPAYRVRPLLARLGGAGEVERFRQHLGLGGTVGNDGHAQQVSLGWPPGCRIDDVVRGPASLDQLRRSTPVVATAPPVSWSVSTPSAVSTPTGQLPPRTAMSPPASTRQGPAAAACRRAGRPPSPSRCRRGRAGCRLELDQPRPRIDRDPATAAGGRVVAATVPSTARKSVVAGSHERIVDGRVEPAVGAQPGLHGELRNLEELGPWSKLPARLSAESSDPLEIGKRASTLKISRSAAASDQEGLHARGPLEQQLDVRAHCTEGTALHHDVPVTTSGGRVTTRPRVGATAPAVRPSPSRSCAGALLHDLLDEPGFPAEQPLSLRECCEPRIGGGCLPRVGGNPSPEDEERSSARRGRTGGRCD